MAYGLQFFNDTTGELILSDYGKVFSYLGQAGFTAIKQGDTVTNGGERNCGYSTYQFDYAGDIVPIIPLKASFYTSLKSVTRSGNTHTIKVINQTVDPSESQFGTQYQTEVYIFGSPPSTVSGYGVALYDDNGNVVADLSRYPLTFRDRIFSPDGQAGYTLPGGMSKPCIVGTPNSRRRDTTASTSYTDCGNCWFRSDNGLYVYPSFYNETWTRLETGEAQKPVILTYRPATGLLVDLFNI